MAVTRYLGGLQAREHEPGLAPRYVPHQLLARGHVHLAQEDSQIICPLSLKSPPVCHTKPTDDTLAGEERSECIPSGKFPNDVSSI